VRRVDHRQFEAAAAPLARRCGASFASCKQPGHGTKRPRRPGSLNEKTSAAQRFYDLKAFPHTFAELDKEEAP
jgi:hypothetical protein